MTLSPPGDGLQDFEELCSSAQSLCPEVVSCPFPGNVLALITNLSVFPSAHESSSCYLVAPLSTEPV